MVEPDDAYRTKLLAFLAKFKTNNVWDMKKPYLVIEHATEAQALYDLLLKHELKAELITAS